MSDAIDAIVMLAEYAGRAGGQGILILCMSGVLYYLYRCLSRAERNVIELRDTLETERAQHAKQLLQCGVDTSRLECKYERLVNKLQRKIDTLNMFILSNGINDTTHTQQLYKFITLINDDGSSNAIENED